MNCPKEPMIPVYLFVGGCFGLLKLVQALWKQWRLRRQERFDRDDSTDIAEMQNGRSGSLALNESSQCIDLSISLFLFVWFCFGNYWVRLYEYNFLR